MTALAEDQVPEFALPPALAEQPISRVITIPPAAPVATAVTHPPDPEPPPRIILPGSEVDKLQSWYREVRPRLEGGSTGGATIGRLDLFWGEIVTLDGNTTGQTVAEKRREDRAELLERPRRMVRHLRNRLGSCFNQRITAEAFFGWLLGEDFDCVIADAPAIWRDAVLYTRTVYAEWNLRGMPDPLPEDLQRRLLIPINNLDRSFRDRAEDEVTVNITAETRAASGRSPNERMSLVYGPISSALRCCGIRANEVLEEYFGVSGEGWAKGAAKHGQLGALYWLTPVGAKVLAEAEAERVKLGQPDRGYHARRRMLDLVTSGKGEKEVGLVGAAGGAAGAVKKFAPLDNRGRVGRRKNELAAQSDALLQAALREYWPALRAARAGEDGKAARRWAGERG